MVKSFSNLDVSGPMASEHRMGVKRTLTEDHSCTTSSMRPWSIVKHWSQEILAAAFSNAALSWYVEMPVRTEASLNDRQSTL